MAQVAHESTHFSETLEGASGKAYEDSAILGNTQPGDGPRFKGRGLMQLTGRDAYTKYGEHIGLDILTGDKMKLIEQEPYASDSAGWFWHVYKKSKNLNARADRDDVAAVTRAIQGGKGGLKKRKEFTANAKRVFSLP